LCSMPPVRLVGPEALCFRLVRLCVRASAWMHSPTVLPSPSSFHSGMSSVSVQQLCEYFNREPMVLGSLAFSTVASMSTAIR